MKVLYIGGTGRTGSTLLDRVLGSAPSWFSGGELAFIWRHGLVADGLCSCGDELRICPIWGPILKEAAVSDPIVAERMVKLRRRFWSVHMPLLVLPGEKKRRLDRLEEFPSVVESLYRSVGDVTGCRVLIDSSKEPHYSMILKEQTELNVRFLHLVRDPRAVGYSWTRKRPEKGHRDAVDMEQRGPLRSSLYYTVSNLAAERFWREEPSGYMLLRYEDLVANPKLWFQRIAEFMDEELDLAGVLDGTVFTPRPTHMVWGNPNRFDGTPRPIRLDDAWKSDQGWAKSLFLSVANAPIASHYGYRIMSTKPVAAVEMNDKKGNGPFDWDTTWEVVKDWQGWLRESQAKALWNAGRMVAIDGLIVEIGSFQGKSTAVLARSSRDGVCVVAVDPHAGNDRDPGEWEGLVEDGQRDNDAFNANLTSAGITDRVNHVREFSSLAGAAVEGSIDFLYIDGAHGYGPVSDDLIRWGSRVVPSGRMYVHDVFNSAWVTVAVLRHLALSRRWRYLGRARSLAMYERSDLGPMGIARNSLLHIASLPWFARNLFLKLLRTLRLEKFGKLLGHVPGEGTY